ncbi:hypothetical protein ACI2L1_21045 [Streptomyces sp. NPDC019531]|uniref:hypothetical protein n=1 Tax=Streptomyces sp. NPDC019531 TaxID=3365062 RepID=UPI0038517C89
MTAVDPFAFVPASLLTLVPGVLALARCWIRHRTVVRTEEENTLRTRIAVQGSDPLRRAEVVKASAELHSPVGRTRRGR